jgi:hypothetical protein
MLRLLPSVFDDVTLFGGEGKPSIEFIAFDDLVPLGTDLLKNAVARIILELEQGVHGNLAKGLVSTRAHLLSRCHILSLFY